MQKDSKLGIMTNVGKNKLEKVDFTKIHKISDACANSFGSYQRLNSVWEMFSRFYIKFNFLWKNGVSGKIKTLQ